MTAAVTDTNFAADVLKSAEPVVVDFWAEWCGPCKMIAPHLEELSAELGGKVKIVKLNIDENQQTAIRYGVRSIPTLIMFKNGEPVDMKVGAGPKSDLQKWITNAAAEVSEPGRQAQTSPVVIPVSPQAKTGTHSP